LKASLVRLQHPRQHPSARLKPGQVRPGLAQRIGFGLKAGAKRVVSLRRLLPVEAIAIILLCLEKHLEHP
jgi:hypothetical protein